MTTAQVDPQVDTLAARRAYIERNNARQRNFWWWFQREGGIFSSISQLPTVMLICLEHERRLCLCSYPYTQATRRLYSFLRKRPLSEWSGRIPWSDYFEPFCEEHSHLITREIAINYAKIKMRGMFSRRRTPPPSRPTTGNDNAQTMENKHYSMPSFGIDGDLWEVKQKFLQMIYVLNEKTQAWVDKRNRTLQLPPSYVGVHMRRGDKVWEGEAELIPTDAYIHKIQEIAPDAQCIFIGTDDYTAVEEFRRQCPQHWQVITSCPEKKRGYNQKIMFAQTAQVINEEHLNALADVAVMVSAQHFIGNYSSNISQTVGQLRGNKNCHTLDRHLRYCHNVSINRENTVLKWNTWYGGGGEQLEIVRRT